MKHTWEILGQVWTPDLIKRIAHRLKLHTDTVGAWIRPPESDDFPTGTGKKNILDHCEFVTRQIHISFPGTAREIAEYFVRLVDRLDCATGEKSSADSPCIALANAVKESADVVVLLSREPDNPAVWERARQEIAESVSALRQLDGCLENLINKKKNE